MMKLLPLGGISPASVGVGRVTRVPLKKLRVDSPSSPPAEQSAPGTARQVRDFSTKTPRQRAVALAELTAW